MKCAMDILTKTVILLSVAEMWDDGEHGGKAIWLVEGVCRGCMWRQEEKQKGK